MGATGEMEFVIPISLDALQEAPSTRQYAVTNISSVREIPKKIEGAVYDVIIKIYFFQICLYSVIIGIFTVRVQLY